MGTWVFVFRDAVRERLLSDARHCRSFEFFRCCRSVSTSCPSSSFDICYSYSSSYSSSNYYRYLCYTFYSVSFDICLPYSNSYSASYSSSSNDICCSYSSSYSASYSYSSHDFCVSFACTTAPSSDLSSITHSSPSYHIQPAAPLVSSSHLFYPRLLRLRGVRLLRRLLLLPRE
jgi:hypothetical protein